MVLNITEISVNKVKEIIKGNKLGLMVPNLSLLGSKTFHMDLGYS